MLKLERAKNKLLQVSTKDNVETDEWLRTGLLLILGSQTLVV